MQKDQVLGLTLGQALSGDLTLLLTLKEKYLKESHYFLDSMLKGVFVAKGQ